jgi:hypothetical protein
MPEKQELIPALMWDWKLQLHVPLDFGKEHRRAFGIGYFHTQSTGIEYTYCIFLPP